jgi:hypothetical protein
MERHLRYILLLIDNRSDGVAEGQKLLYHAFMGGVMGRVVRTALPVRGESPFRFVPNGTKSHEGS